MIDSGVARDSRIGDTSVFSTQKSRAEKEQKKIVVVRRFEVSSIWYYPSPSPYPHPNYAYSPVVNESHDRSRLNRGRIPRAYRGYVNVDWVNIIGLTLSYIGVLIDGLSCS